MAVPSCSGMIGKRITLPGKNAEGGFFQKHPKGERNSPVFFLVLLMCLGSGRGVRF